MVYSNIVRSSLNGSHSSQMTCRYIEFWELRTVLTSTDICPFLVPPMENVSQCFLLVEYTDMCCGYLQDSTLYHHLYPRRSICKPIAHLKVVCNRIMNTHSFYSLIFSQKSEIRYHSQYRKHQKNIRKVLSGISEYQIWVQ